MVSEPGNRRKFPKRFNNLLGMSDNQTPYLGIHHSTYLRLEPTWYSARPVIVSVVPMTDKDLQSRGDTAKRRANQERDDRRHFALMSGQLPPLPFSFSFSSSLSFLSARERMVPELDPTVHTEIWTKAAC